MNRIVKTFEKAFTRKEERDWDRIYVMVDVHETILKPNYGGISSEYYPFAKDVLRYLSEREDIILIMWTCSTEEDRKAYDELFKSDGINFNYINENPEVADKFKWGDFITKMYTNVILDDKAGFLFEEDWEALSNFFKDSITELEVGDG